VLDRLRNNLGLKVLSLAIAIAGWAYLRLTPNPVIAAHFVQTLTVPISTTGLPGDEVARVADKQAVVVIDVPRSGVAVEPREVRAVLDLSGRGPGFYNVPLAVIAPKFSIKSLSPASVTLDVERIEERTVPVALHYSGNLHGNVVVSDARIQPATATLRAATSDLANVASVRVDVPLPSEPATLDAMLRPVATDAHGTEIAAVSVAPNLVRVRAAFVAAKKNL
jgi:YbbR domain-containing protein